MSPPVYRWLGIWEFGDLGIWVFGEVETMLAQMRVQEEFCLQRATCLTSSVGLFKLTEDSVIFGSGSSLCKGL